MIISSETLWWLLLQVAKVSSINLGSIKIIFIKDTHREKALSNNTPALTKSMNMGIWIFGISNQLFIRGS